MGDEKNESNQFDSFAFQFVEGKNSNLIQLNNTTRYLITMLLKYFPEENDFCPHNQFSIH